MSARWERHPRDRDAGGFPFSKRQARPVFYLFMACGCLTAFGWQSRRMSKGGTWRRSERGRSAIVTLGGDFSKEHLFRLILSCSGAVARLLSSIPAPTAVQGLSSMTNCERKSAHEREVN